MSDTKRDDGKLDVCCPLCRGNLVVDRDSGVVLHAAAAKRGGSDFEEVLGQIREAQGSRDEQFQQAFQSERQRRASLDKKFETAREKAAEDPDKKRFNPLDFD